MYVCMDIRVCALEAGTGESVSVFIQMCVCTCITRTVARAGVKLVQVVPRLLPINSVTKDWLNQGRIESRGRVYLPVFSTYVSMSQGCVCVHAQCCFRLPTLPTGPTYAH